MQATAGIGQTMIAGPVLAAIDAAVIPGPAILLAAGPNLRNALGDWASVDARALRRQLIGAPVGIALGLSLVALLSDRAIAIAVAVFVLVSVGLQFLGRRPPHRPQTDFAAGAATAFSTVAAGLPGPTYAVFYGHRDPAMLRATVSRFNLTVMVATITVLVATGIFGTHELWLTLIFLPATLLGLPIAAVLRPRVEGARFRILILTLASINASLVLARQLFFS
ncbi:MAG: putative membrane protein YfcA [Candidatus Poriferisodalaceae bacterium]|jgi:uncharacterized membrane protein YfcA